MHKFLFVAVNAKYIHTSLSARTICSYVNSDELNFVEYTINEHAEAVAADIYSKKPQTVLFSCYIWNIEFCLKVAEILKNVLDNVCIILGGPEVSFDDTEYMEYPFVDAIIRGEGEETVKELVEKNDFSIDGITYRQNGEIIRNPERGNIKDISVLPFPYTDKDLEENKNKLIYYESSRGCPFGCSYCMSSVEHSVCFKDANKVKNELLKFIEKDVRIVKFTDRTFNADKKRTKELIKFLIANAKNTMFHFEIAADIFDDELGEIINNAPKDLFRFEIGVQSTNTKTLESIDRRSDFSKISDTVKKLQRGNNVHIHIDLIAGLPYEDLESFKKSFNDVYSLNCDVLQLGFLKLLRGTKIRRESEKYGYRFINKPVYEVLGNSFLKYEELLELKEIENVFELFSNSGVFKNSIKYLEKLYDTPYELYKALSVFFKENGYDKIGISRMGLYEVLTEFCNEEMFKDVVKLDYFMFNKTDKSPSWSLIPYDVSILKERFEILNEEFINNNFPNYSSLHIKEALKHLHFERFAYDVLESGKREECIIVFDRDGEMCVKV